MAISVCNARSLPLPVDLHESSTFSSTANWAGVWGGLFGCDCLRCRRRRRRRRRCRCRANYCHASTRVCARPASESPRDRASCARLWCTPAELETQASERACSATTICSLHLSQRAYKRARMCMHMCVYIRVRFNNTAARSHL